MDAVHMEKAMRPREHLVPPDPIVVPAPARSTYRHGDLYRALLDAGIELARAGGPDAVVLREATRRAGVVPNAAYRHFASRQELLQAVRAAAVSAVAVAMEAELDKVPRRLKGAAAARAALRAVGTGYMRFALAETGLFRMAFVAPEKIDITHEEAKTGNTGLDPFQLLGAALDQMVEAGVLTPERRPGAEFLAWGAVHGLAMLTIDGPLRGIPAVQAEAMGQRLLDMVEKGI
ncbi:TetR/AcrR family transcriptional regulator [Variovorax sp. PAMC28562]|nr:TetR/AcrR family transcriptional regulator [Variovorax sp. PAMC28562]